MPFSIRPLPSIALQFPVAFVLSIVFLAVPAWADFQAGMDAYNRGDCARALREWRTQAERGHAVIVGAQQENVRTNKGLRNQHEQSRDVVKRLEVAGGSA